MNTPSSRPCPGPATDPVVDAGPRPAAPAAHPDPLEVLDVLAALAPDTGDERTQHELEETLARLTEIVGRWSR